MSASHNGSLWVNITGGNSEPGIGNDWFLVTESVIDNKVTVFGNEFELIKHPSNSTNGVVEVNDIISNGWVDSTTYWPMAICLSVTDINNLSSWQKINSIEEITIN